MRWPADLCFAASLLVGTTAFGQTVESWGSRAVAIDTVIGLQDFYADAGVSRAQVMVDLAATVEISPGVQATLRPKLWRQRGDWRTLLDQASLRYEWTRRGNWRVEAGRFPSPMGLGLVENRPNLNAGLLWYYRPYYMPLPSLGTGAPRVSLVSTVYPEGVQLSTSHRRWDARVALVDRAPVEFWLPEPSTGRRASVVAGGGVTPRQGLRIGGGVATGRLATPAQASWSYRMVTFEAEWAVGHTKLSGEWAQDVFDTRLGGAQAAQGWTMQARQTLSPRLFLHARATTMDAAAFAAGAYGRRQYHAVDSTVGYLVTPDVTVRGGHALTRAFGSTRSDHQVGVSVMWSRRWW